jgi:biotin carboxylase
MAAMKTLMIVGAGKLQIPAYAAARRLGLKTIAIDANPRAPGMALADTSFAIDTRDAASAIKVAHDLRIDGVVTLCTDFPVRTVAAVAEALKLPGMSLENAIKVTNKVMMREAFVKYLSPSPKFRTAVSLEEARLSVVEIGLPSVFKPVVSSGSRGVIKVEKHEMVDIAFHYSMKSNGSEKEVIVEEFVDGPEVSVETISWDGIHHIIAITDKITTGDPYWVELGHSQPSGLPKASKMAIAECAESGLDALGISNSPAHVEIKMGSEGPKLIEIGARLGGDYITTELVPRSTGIDMVTCAIQMALGIEPEIRATKNAAASIRYFAAIPGKIIAIDGIEEARRSRGVVRIEIEKEPGDTIGDLRSSVDRFGYIICEGETRKEVQDDIEAAMKRVVLTVRKE